MFYNLSLVQYKKKLKLHSLLKKKQLKLLKRPKIFSYFFISLDGRIFVLNRFIFVHNKFINFKYLLEN